MNKKILVYGNCQTASLMQVLNLPEIYEVHIIRCFSTQLNKAEFAKIISESDIIIAQAIHDNYRDVDYLSTSYILKHKKPNCKMVLFDVLHFSFYYFDIKNIDSFKIPTPYHYKSMVEYFKSGHAVDHYITDFVDNKNLKTSEELEIIANDSLNELHKRYIRNTEKYGSDKTVTIVSAYDFIKENYRDKLLFHCRNHPTKDVFQFVSERIVDLLQLPHAIDYNIDPLDYTQCIVYGCVQKNINFKIENKFTVINKNKYSIQEAVQLYYDAYSKHGLPAWLE